MKTKTKITICVIGTVVTIPVALFAYLVFAYSITLAQWMINGYDTHKPKTRIELEHHLYFASTHMQKSFTNQQYGAMHRWNAKAGRFEGTSKNDAYTPETGDKYVTYNVLGVMPIDAVYDSNDNVKIVFQTFDH